MAADNADRERWGALFAKLDANKDGKIEVSELAAALRDLQGVSANEATTEAEKIVSKGDKNESVALDVNEFMEYMQNHEQKLKLAFSDLDRNKDGKIEPAEVQAALEQLGVVIDLAEAEKLTKRLDKDNSLSVSWDEWRNFFQLHSSAELDQIVKYWRKSLMIDIGDSMTVPPDFTQKEKQTGMWWRHLVAGGLAGAVSRTSTAPLDRLKILLQVQSSSQSNVGIIGGLKQMVKEGGVKSLWRGNGTNVIKIAPESALKFAAYEQLKKALKGPTGETSVVERFAAGSTAGAIAQTAIYPMEVIKTRLAVMKTGEYKGIIDCGLKVSQREGLRALYKGYIPNILGIIPYAGIDLTIYESLKQAYLHRHPETKNPGVLLLLACGTLSSTCGQLATYPLALIRTRLQAQVSTAGSKQGLVAMTRDIIAREGLWGLYRGIVPNFLKVLPAVSVSYVIYEQTKVKLGIK